ncbi:AfsR/SARP family transcriptional regulator [Streptomyces sp. ACA25]|uniref:AfsR/SARP family transcriptional regulator n=1 Tax=Streptomyces sp. ACA25 TaxID=3022596 RepID=UPI0023083606|nr:AfsR/SARP family transcriptional regulator [Streptomyces sp. ACA25]MDB1089339.1 AfsR/SARP family transcriptional regulator [Streptomyces sp. ACA25]
MRFEVLGPLSVTDRREGRSLLPSAPKKKALLAALLSRVGQVVSTAGLMSELWAGEPPRKARAALHVYMAQLRNQLAEGSGTAGITTEGPGYMLRLGDAEFDHHEFTTLLAQGRTLQQAGDLEEAAVRVHRALDLWRGPALSGLTDGPMLGVFATCLDEEYIAGIEMRLEIDLQLGRHREIVTDLVRLVNDHPLRETFYRQLMVAFYRSERQADALKCYHLLRGRLQDELGVEPCRSLQQLHQAVLRADPVLDRYRLQAVS